jgi:hypothetical protein
VIQSSTPESTIMTKCTTPSISFPRFKGRQVTAGFDGGEITSDGGALLLRDFVAGYSL